MEALAKKMAEAIGQGTGKSAEEIAVIAYGLIGILQFSAIFLLSSIIGVVFGFWLEVATVFLSVGFLRRLTGGAHSSGIYSCLVYSVFFVCGISVLARYAIAALPMQYAWIGCAVIFVFGYVTVARKAPVAPPNKPCRTEAKRKRLRRGSFVVLSLFMVAVGLALWGGVTAPRLYSLGIALAISTLWQIVMMTKAGHAFVSLIDGLFAPKA